MDRHVPWSARIERVLANLGANYSRRQEIRAYCERVFGRKPPSPRLKLSHQAQGVLFSWNVDPQAIYEVQEYLDELSSQLYGYSEEAQEARKAEAAERQREYRSQHRTEYNEYQRAYMRERRAKGLDKPAKKPRVLRD